MPLGPLVDKLQKTFGDKLVQNVPLAPLTTFGIGGPADWMFTPADVADLQELMSVCKGHDVPMFVLGKGTNLLVNDGGIRGITINMADNFRQIEHERKGDDVYLTVGTSLTLEQVLDYCEGNDVMGMEFSSGVPGGIGGAIRGNAGTRDGAIGDVAYKVSFVNEAGALKVLSGDDLQFRYRGLKLKGRFVLTQAVLKLRHGDGLKLKKKREMIVKWRHEKQPYNAACAGCVFVNPDQGSAGRLVDESGCKGLKVGGAEVSGKHANFIVSDGTATAADVMELINQVRKRVFAASGILLETEIKIVGEAK